MLDVDCCKCGDGDHGQNAGDKNDKGDEDYDSVICATCFAQTGKCCKDMSHCRGWLLMFADGGMFSVMAYSKSWMQKGKMGPNGEVDKVAVEGMRHWRADTGETEGNNEETQEPTEATEKLQGGEEQEDDEDEVVEDDDG